MQKKHQRVEYYSSPLIEEEEWCKSKCLSKQFSLEKFEGGLSNFSTISTIRAPKLFVERESQALGGQGWVQGESTDKSESTKNWDSFGYIVQCVRLNILSRKRFNCISDLIQKNRYYANDQLYPMA